MDEHQQQLARLASLDQTRKTTLAVYESTRAMLHDMAQAGCVDNVAYAKARTIIATYRDAADVAESAYLALFDELYPEASVFSYRIVGEAYFVQPA